LYALKDAGFEIGYHNATFCSSLRDETIRGIERFKEFFGYYPKTIANHSKIEKTYTGVNIELQELIDFFIIYFRKIVIKVFSGTHRK